MDVSKDEENSEDEEEEEEVEEEEEEEKKPGDDSDLTLSIKVARGAAHALWGILFHKILK